MLAIQFVDLFGQQLGLWRVPGSFNGMTSLAVSLGAVVVLLIAAFVFVAWRDRKRLSSPEDSAAGRDARSAQERHAAERHGAQGEVWRRGQNSTST
ncbi:hypothetical protein [Micromonospora sp. NPDC005254]|uniref:hypothetical protein n=1 Tax=Micromonospora sp. NPDC005254 TaxID=3364229 RepID=UPI003679F75D